MVRVRESLVTGNSFPLTGIRFGPIRLMVSAAAADADTDADLL
jgi:hypothetical protein